MLRMILIIAAGILLAILLLPLLGPLSWIALVAVIIIAIMVGFAKIKEMWQDEKQRPRLVVAASITGMVIALAGFLGYDTNHDAFDMGVLIFGLVLAFGPPLFMWLTSEPGKAKIKETKDAAYALKAGEAPEQAKARKKRIVLVSVAAAAVIAALALAPRISDGFHEAAEKREAYHTDVSLAEEGYYDEAIKAFRALGDYKDSADMVEKTKSQKVEAEYQRAAALLESGEYDGAIAAIEALGDYKDSADYINQAYE